MAAWSRILCVTGLGDGCRVAVEQAAEIARASGATLTLLHVSPTGPVSPGWSDVGAAGVDAGEASRALEHQRATAERIAGGPVRAAIRSGSVVPEVLRLLAEDPHDLLVVGVRRRASLGWLVMGSVANRLMREAPCPVLMARRSESADLADGAVGGLA